MNATTAVVRTEARLFAREPGSVFWILVFPTLILGVLGAIPSSRQPDAALGGLRLVDAYTSVSVMLAMIVAAVISMPPIIAGYRERRILRRLRTTPIHPGSLLAAQVGVHALAVLSSVTLALLVSSLAFDVAWPAPFGWYALTVLMATAATFALGAVITALARTARAAQTLGMAAFFPLMFTAGVYLPVPAMTGWLRDLVAATPLGAAAEAFNDVTLGRAPEALDLAVIAGWTVVAWLIAVRSFRWE